MGKRVLITGATGMIGGLVLNHCLASDEVDEIIIIGRRLCGISHVKITELLVEDFAHLDAKADCFREIDTAFFCLGVYTGAVDRQRFKEITVDYPEQLARILIQTSPDVRFCLLSGAGADRSERSRMMFAKDKGIIENRLSRIFPNSFHAFRPGYIYPVTPRSEPNFSYRLMRNLYPLLKLFGPNASIRSDELARAMFHVGLHSWPEEILENRDILQAAA